MSVPMKPDDPAYFLLERGRNDPSKRSTTTVYKAQCKRPRFEIVDAVVRQSSDAAFHCVSICIFYTEDLANKKRAA